MAADPLDNAAEFTDLFTQASIDRAREVTVKLPFTGRCHNCGDPVPHPDRFCVGEGCAEDWEYIQKRKRINGFT